ncbi:tripartite tricarboxylate transporter permease [Methanobrevibacter wolinii]|uniref:tripartite tricarboxylate transporter permease n=1 Tax=Methanobrevibacter wolinii TaxID=190977 RepID=UPI0005B252F6|nr:tripartite tricarboxylate transporter permease [Methanobrevibacter wolinii]
MIDLIIACIFGILIGCITGLFPGIHVNTSGAIIYTLSPYLLNFISPEAICIFLASLAISHALLEFIPSILLGVPEESTALSILPGHRMVIEGRGKEAIRIVSIGGYGAIIITIITLPLFILILPNFHNISKPYLWLILILISIILIYKLNYNNKNRLWSLILFLLSGLIGWSVFETPLSSNLSLMATFTGLFGISTIIFSLNDDSIIPHQNQFFEVDLDKTKLKNIFLGGISGAILGFLPSFGPAQGGIIAQDISNTSDEDDDASNFLTVISGINTSDCLFSLISLYLIGNPRSGIAIYISYIIKKFTLNILIMFIGVSLTSVSLSLIFAILIGDKFINIIEKIDYMKTSKIAIFIMIIIVYIFTIINKGPLWYITILLISSTALGLIPHFQGVSKSHLMGVLIVPAIIIYFNMYY